MMKRTAYVFQILILLVTLPTIAKPPIATESRVPGGVAIVPLHAATAPTVTFEGHPVLVVPDDTKTNQWWAVVGIPLGHTLGATQLEVKTARKQWVTSFEISAKDYPTEKLTIKQKKGGKKANPEVDARLRKERAQLDQAFSAWRAQPVLDMTLRTPLQGRRSGAFGARRIYNEVPGAYHRGIDIAAPTGTTIKAARAGRVLVSDTFLLTGNTVIIDHGQGFQTVYCHLNQRQVTSGQQVERAEPIGTVGKTGRATGPHLHFGVSLNNTRIDPDLFLP